VRVADAEDHRVGEATAKWDVLVPRERPSPPEAPRVTLAEPLEQVPVARAGAAQHPSPLDAAALVDDPGHPHTGPAGLAELQPQIPVLIAARDVRAEGLPCADLLERGAANQRSDRNEVRPRLRP